MPKVGLSRPYVARYHENGAGIVSYSGGVRAGRAVNYSFALNNTGTDNKFFCDNEAGESASRVFSGGTLTWGVAELEQAISEMILGLRRQQIQVGEDTVEELIYDETMESPYLGAGIIEKSIVRGQVKYRGLLFTKTQFNVPEDSATTQGETIEWQTDTITANVLRDDSTSHMWRRTAVFDSEAKADAYLCHLLNIQDATLEQLTVQSSAGSSPGTTSLQVTPELTEGRSYRYMTGSNVQMPSLYQDLSHWALWDGETDVEAATGDQIVVAEVDAIGLCMAAGSTTVTAQAGG